MQIEEIKQEDLKREYKVVFTADEVETRVVSRLEEVKTQIRMPGFRPGKAPLNLLRQLHGKAVLGEILEQMVQEGSDQVFTQKDIKPAMRPDVEVMAFNEGSPLEFRLAVEILPEVQVPDFTKIKLERLIAEPGEKEIDAAVEKLASGHKRFEDAAKTRKAQLGDVVVIDFSGLIEGELFEGGTSENHQLELGSGSFIPGFEEQLVGSKAGAKLDVTVNFPDDYHADRLAGKEAVFAVTLHLVKIPVKATVNDQLAQELGLPDLAALRENVGTHVGQESAELSRKILKRKLLDALAERVDFMVPAGMVDMEYAEIWEQIKRDAIMLGGASPEDVAGLTEPESEEEREEFRRIAERRVRLGLLLSEVGTQNDVQVTQEEVSRRIMMEAQKFPGQEKEVFDYYQKNENAMAGLRAPIYEEKVCDLILGGAKVAEKKVSRETLEAALKTLEEEDAKAASGEKAAKSKKAKPAKKAKTASKPKKVKSKAEPKAKKAAKTKPKS